MFKTICLKKTGTKSIIKEHAYQNFYETDTTSNSFPIKPVVVRHRKCTNIIQNLIYL